LLKYPNFHLADFDNPPVVETVLSLQFERLTALRAVHFGLFWEKVKDRFPKSEEQPPLLPVFERFPEPIPPSGQVLFETIQAPTLLRVWLINDVGTEIIQLQNGRFIKNWRKSGHHDVYPHYEPVIKPAFERDLREFQLFLGEEKLGELKVTQCEVTYVNHIVSGDGTDLARFSGSSAFGGSDPLRFRGTLMISACGFAFPSRMKKEHRGCTAMIWISLILEGGGL
jgi:uncharacterized protein (TIGR04255 family)